MQNKIFDEADGWGTERLSGIISINHLRLNKSQIIFKNKRIRQEELFNREFARR